MLSLYSLTFVSCRTVNKDDDDIEYSYGVIPPCNAYTVDYDVIYHHNAYYTVNDVVVGQKQSDLHDYLAYQKRGSVTFYSEWKMVTETKDEIKAIFADLNFHVKQFRVPLSSPYSPSDHRRLFKKMEGEELERVRAKFPKDADLSKTSIVKLTDDQTLLTNIATNDKESTYAREAAISGLTDQRLLETIAKNDEVWWIREAAIWQLNDQAALTEISENDKNMQVRKAAIRQINRLKEQNQ